MYVNPSVADSLLRSVPTMPTKFDWYPILHVAAKCCSIPAVHVLLGAGADTDNADTNGTLAIDQIGPLLPDDNRNGSTEEAVRRMLQKGPAFRARSWAWPGTTDITLGGPSKAPSSSSAPVLKTSMRMGAQLFKPMGERLDISRNFDW